MTCRVEIFRSSGCLEQSLKFLNLLKIKCRDANLFSVVCCTEPINIFHSSYKTDYEPIRLSYNGIHYNSVLNPNEPSVGVGLGLSGYKPWVSKVVHSVAHTYSLIYYAVQRRSHEQLSVLILQYAQIPVTCSKSNIWLYFCL